MQFDNKASRALGGLGRGMRRAEMDMGSSALREIARVRAAQYGADATAYAARKQRDAARFGAIAGAIGNIGGAVAGGLINQARIGGNQNTNDFNAGDAQVMGMSPAEAEYRGSGGTTYWDSDMPTNSWKPYEQASSGFGGFGRTNYGYGTSYFS